MSDEFRDDKIVAELDYDTMLDLNAIIYWESMFPDDAMQLQVLKDKPLGAGGRLVSVNEAIKKLIRVFREERRIRNDFGSQLLRKKDTPLPRQSVIDTINALYDSNEDTNSDRCD